MIGQTVSHYRITKQLGAGGMGVVYEAEDTRLKRTVALKFLAPEMTRGPEAKARFIHEAQAASSMDHPNVCTIYEIDETDDGKLFIAMACYEGETLKERIARGPLPLEEALDITRQIAEGLAKAHERDIVHRDVKSANIFVTEDGLVKILDFGLAKLAGQTRLTKTGTTMGTAAYLSPEQARGDSTDHRSDIWSLGVTLYEMITGQLPFKGQHEALAYSILNARPEPLTGMRTGIPKDLDLIVNKCMVKDADERYQTAADLVADLRRLRRTMTPAGREPVISSAAESGHTSVPPRTDNSRRTSILVTLAVLVIVCAIVILRPIIAPTERQSVEGRKMLVVLPFENLGRSDDTYFADGISEEITSRLASLPMLGVISRTSALQYRETDKTIRQIGEELGVDYVLEGTVRWDHEQGGVSRVRITPQLIRVSDDTHLWADRYDRELKDIFEVQSDIARQVVTQLDITLLEGQNRALTVRPTGNMDAYQAYLRGLDQQQRMGLSPDAKTLAPSMFERAVEIDPDFALAYAELSITHSYIYYVRYDPSLDRLAMAKQAVENALKIQPDLPQAHLALGYYWGNRDYDTAIREFTLARRDLPNNSRVYELLGYTQFRRGSLEEALVSFEEAYKLNPKDSAVITHLAYSCQFLRRYEKADTYWDQAISVTPDYTGPYEGKASNYWHWKGVTGPARMVLERMPVTTDPDWTLESWYNLNLYERNYESALEQVASMSSEIYDAQSLFSPKSQFAGLVYYFMGNFERAEEFCDSARAVLEAEAEKLPDDFRIHSSLGIVYAVLGRGDDAIREGKLAVKLGASWWGERLGRSTVRDLAFAYVLLGDYDSALEQLDHLLSIPSDFSIGLLKLDPRWDPLRTHHRYRALIEKYTGDGS